MRKFCSIGRHRRLKIWIINKDNLKQPKQMMNGSWWLRLKILIVVVVLISTLGYPQNANCFKKSIWRKPNRWVWESNVSRFRSPFCFKFLRSYKIPIWPSLIEGSWVFRYIRIFPLAKKSVVSSPTASRTFSNRKEGLEDQLNTKKNSEKK